MKQISIVIILTLCSALFSASISGFISNASNGEKLAYANAIIIETEQGALANEQGYFVINRMRAGKYTLQFSMIGYKVKRLNLELIDHIDNKFINIELEPSSIKTSGISVRAERFSNFEINKQQIEVGKVNIRTETIKNIGALGEPDVMKALKTLPGVNTVSDFSSGLYVRGGTPDQNLILLDGIDVYNPNHVGGIFSTFNADAISNVELIKGGFPANYGGRLSSVLKVTNLDGNRKKIQGNANASIISTNITLHGPLEIGKIKGSFMGSFRRTYLDIIFKIAEKMKKIDADEIPNYYFYDGHAKVNFDLSPKDFLTLSYYSGRDYLTLDESIIDELDINWGNGTSAAILTHVFSPELISKSILAYSQYSSKFLIADSMDDEDGDEDDEFYYNRGNKIADYTFNSSLEYLPNHKHKVEFGLNAKFNKIGYEETIEAEDLEDIDYHPELDFSAFTSSIYITDSWKFADFWTMQPGLRINQHFTQSDYIAGKPSENFLNISPRISLRKEISTSSNAYLSYGRYYQYLNSFSSEFAALDIWLPQDNTISPSSADHYIAGCKTLLWKNHVLDVEAYYKNMDNIAEHYDTSDIDWSDENLQMADLFKFGKGFAYGLEFMLRSQILGLEGFSSYSYSVTSKKIPGMNINTDTGKEEYFHPRHDRTHTVNIVETYNLTEHLGFKIFGGETKVGITYNFGSGQPYKTPEYTMNDEGEKIIEYNYREEKRLGSYHRLDLSLRFSKKRKHHIFEPYIQIINVTNHKNDYQINFDDIEEVNGETTYTEDKMSMLPLLPFFGLSWYF